MIAILTCIECPMGCPITLTHEDGKILSLSGNGCARGALYAKDEIACPRRILTTTVRCSDGKLVSVKTSGGIPKNEMAEAMKIISALRPTPPIAIGDVLCKEISSGVDLIATADHV